MAKLEGFFVDMFYNIFSCVRNILIDSLLIVFGGKMAEKRCKKIWRNGIKCLPLHSLLGSDAAERVRHKA